MPPSAWRNLPGRSRSAPVKAPRRVAEQLAFDQGVGDGGAVDRHEGRLGAVGQLVDAPRHQLLAGAGFAADQHARGDGGDAVDGVENALHGRRFAEQPAGAREAPDLVGEAAVLMAEAGGLQGVAHDETQLVDLVRLRQVVGGAGFHRVDGGAQVRIGGDHDDRWERRGRGEGGEVAEGGHAVHARHAEVEEHEVDAVPRLGQHLDAGAAVAAFHEVVVGRAEGADGPPPRRGLVVADQNALSVHAGVSSTRTRKAMRSG